MCATDAWGLVASALLLQLHNMDLNSISCLSVVLQIAANTAVLGGSVAYVDTGNAFSARRVDDMLQHLHVTVSWRAKCRVVQCC